MRYSIVVVALMALANTGCPKQSESPDAEPVEQAPRPSAGELDTEQSDHETTSEELMREEMVDRQIVARGVTDSRVVAAMRKIPRHEFMPEDVRYRAYADAPSPIGHRQTISQPYIVAAMTELLNVQKGQKILEIGTGSGYQAAVLAELGAELYTIEIICDLADRAEKTLDSLGYEAVNVRCADGYKGWPSEAPFDGIIVTAAPPEIPEALVDQLAVGGRMVVPVGEHYQSLQLITKNLDGTTDVKNIADVAFVPMVHGADTDDGPDSP